jgi:type I restriction enzyme S subunit
MKDLIEQLPVWATAITQKSKGKVKGIDNQHLYGIQKMRELILDLAIRGKLVPQDLNDEPASELLKLVKAEKKKLHVNRKIKKTKPILEISKEEKQFEIPSTWIWCRFTEIAELRHGHQFREYDFVDDGIPVVKIGQCKPDGKLDLTGCNYIHSDRIKEFEDYLIFKDDLLMALTGGTLGKVTRVDKDYGTVVQNYRVGNFFPNEIILSKDYLNVILESDLFQFLVKGKVNQNAQPNIGKDSIEQIVISIPPLNEQKRIVAKVDKLMDLCDELEKQQEEQNKTHYLLVKTLLESLTHAQNAADFQSTWQLISTQFEHLFTTEESIDLLKQSILQLAVMGKLVPQDPSDEPASELLKKIAAEIQKLIKEGKIKKQKPLLEITDEEKPFELPEGWVWTNLAEISQINPRNIVESDIDASFVSMSNVLSSYNGEHGQELKKWSTIKKGYTHFADGDIGLAKITPCFENSKAVIFSSLINGIGAGTTELHIARPIIGTIEPNFILCILKSPVFLKIGESKMTGTAGQKRIPKEFFSNYSFALPPLIEQKRIVTKVNSLFSLCDLLKEKVIKSEDIKVKLSDCLVGGFG